MAAPDPSATRTGLLPARAGLPAPATGGWGVQVRVLSLSVLGRFGEASGKVGTYG